MHRLPVDVYVSRVRVGSVKLSNFLMDANTIFDDIPT